MTWSRPAAVAGSFYPADTEELRRLVEDLLVEAAEGSPVLGKGESGSHPQSPSQSAGVSGAPTWPKAFILPHAGYVYSGPVAASGYARLRPFGDRIRKVVLLGPAHRYPVRGLATSTAGAFETPLGSVPLDQAGLQDVLDLPQVQALDEAHEGEHSLEVHLPFLQVLLGSFQLLPFAVGDATPEEVAEVLALLWGEDETVIIVSSDLSHFLSYAEATELDQVTARTILELRSHGLEYEQACGRLPVAGLMIRAREEGLIPECVDLRNSGDTAGPRHQVVGYGSFVFS